MRVGYVRRSESAAINAIAATIAFWTNPCGICSRNVVVQLKLFFKVLPTKSHPARGGPTQSNLLLWLLAKVALSENCFAGPGIFCQRVLGLQ
mmetsp:Transcript_64522/g.88638  ORF Transcript_64522/g.88638 Transcript_64522/m.88638 type:complete len:92 (-) Transcript_64522:2295-2570(-)